MKSVVVFVFVLGVCRFVAPVSSANHTDVHSFLAEASRRLYALHSDVSSAHREGHRGDQHAALRAASDELRRLSQQAGLFQRQLEQQRQRQSPADAALLRQALRNLRRMGDVYVLGEEALTLRHRLENLRRLSEAADIEPYEGNKRGAEEEAWSSSSNSSLLAYYPTIERIVRRSSDADELKYYWEAWREQNGRWASNNFHRIVQLLRGAARQMGLPVLEFWYAHYDAAFLAEMERVMERLRPLHEQLHAYVRARLFRRYGAGVVKPRGPIADHVFRQVLAQAWAEDGVLARDFPLEQLPPYDRLVQGRRYDPLDLLRLADRFYESLGFAPLPDRFWDGDVGPQPAGESGGACRAHVADETPAVRLRHCARVDFRAFMQAHRHMGRVRYARLKRPLPAYFFDSYGLQSPVGEAVILSASSLRHLRRIGLLEDFDLTEDVLLNRLFRMGIHTLFNIPVYYVHSKLMQDYLLGSVQRQNLNKYYWKLMEVYAGVEPPSDRFETSLDLPNEFYMDLKDNQVTSKFTSEVLGYQFYRALCTTAGHQGPLSNCDFFRSHAAGRSLKNLMALGSSRPWRAVIAELLPAEPRLSADALLEYYEPLRVWLTERNRAQNNSLGWEESRRQLGKSVLTSETEARVFIDESNERIYRIYQQIAEDLFHQRDRQQDAFWKHSQSAVAAHELREIASRAGNFDAKHFRNKDVRRALGRLASQVGGLFVPGSDLGVCREHRRVLNSLPADRDIAPFGRAEGTAPLLAYSPHVQRILANSSSWPELAYYWEAWREKNARWAAEHFGGLVQCVWQAAERLDLPVMNFWYRDYHKDFLQEMSAVMDTIRPLYLRLHGFLRAELLLRYGAGRRWDPHGPIPDHLYRQLLAQAWTNGSVLERHFPAAQLPPYDSFVRRRGWGAQRLLEVADEFYQSLGFTPLEPSFWQQRLRPIDDDVSGEGGDCRAEVYDMTARVYMKHCEQVDFRKLVQAHGHLGRIHYAREKAIQPSYYFESYGLEFPVGEAVILSATTPAHLRTLGLAEDFDFTDEVLLNRLIRMAIHTLLNLQLHFVHAKVMNDFLDGSVALDELNAFYWHQMVEVAGVEPPSDRPEAAFDFPYKFYTDLERNHQTRKFVSEVLGYEFYRALCHRSGHEGPLATCDFYGSRKAGSALKKMMSLGSAKTWRKVIKRLLGGKETGLSADAILEYYEPVRKWLEEQDVEVGWSASSKKF